MSAPRDLSHESTIELVKAKTGFEAETIAAALRDRGINARAVNTITGDMLSHEVSRARVIVLAHELDDAKVMLEQIQSEAGQIDWSQVEVGEAESVPPAPSGRWAWTLSLLLVPVGLVVMSIGTQRADGMLQTIGGVVIVGGLALGAGLMLSGGGGGRGSSGGDSGDARQR